VILRLIAFVIVLAFAAMGLLLPKPPPPVAIEVHPAAYIDQCGTVHTDLLDPRRGDPPFPIRRHDGGTA
jgi:hypothetical protein